MSGLFDARMAAARHDDARSGKLRSLGQGAVSGSLDREELAFRAARGEGAAGLVTGVEEPERHRDDVGFELHQTREGLPAQRVLREIEVEGLPRYLQRSEEHTSELQSLMRISYAVFC